MFQYIVLASLEFQVLAITLVQPTFVNVSMSLRLKCFLVISNVVSTFHEFSVRYCLWHGCSKTLIVLALNHIFLASLWHVLSQCFVWRFQWCSCTRISAEWGFGKKEIWIYFSFFILSSILIRLPISGSEKHFHWDSTGAIKLDCWNSFFELKT